MKRNLFFSPAHRRWERKKVTEAFRITAGKILVNYQVDLNQVDEWLHMIITNNEWMLLES